LSDVLCGKYNDIDFHIIDVRYPYEFQGGHIKTAVNITTVQELEAMFFGENTAFTQRKSVLIFHCEFSLKRGPQM
jgi:rhodanese-related sulfurtransferase